MPVRPHRNLRRAGPLTMSPMQRLRSSTQAHLPVHIAIIGGGLAGITTALALTRVGHRVTVFEQHAEDAPLSSGGVRIPPNQSKVLYRWGLKEALSKIAVISRALRFYTCTSSATADAVRAVLTPSAM
jgi:2-polyprenyl-6-methoxyphenol hydroxylase-like FAD-dependent oxidoreductase